MTIGPTRPPGRGRCRYGGASGGDLPVRAPEPDREQCGRHVPCPPPSGRRSDRTDSRRRAGWPLPPGGTASRRPAGVKAISNPSTTPSSRQAEGDLDPAEVRCRRRRPSGASTANPWSWGVTSTRPGRDRDDRRSIPRCPNLARRCRTQGAAEDLVAEQIPKSGMRRSSTARAKATIASAVAGSPGPLDRNTPSTPSAVISSMVVPAGSTCVRIPRAASICGVLALIPRSRAATEKISSPSAGTT